MHAAWGSGRRRPRWCTMAEPVDLVAATVHDHDVVTGSGTAFLDDGTSVSYDAAAFAAGGLRLLRSGQRVHLHRSDGAVVRITLPA